MRHHSRSLRPLLLLSALASGALGLSSCAAFSEGSGAGTADGVQVVAAFYPLEYAAQRVTGDLAEVEELTTPGAEPHDLELSVAANAAVSDADLVVYERDFQAAVDEAVEQNAPAATLDVAEVVDLVPLDEDELDPHFWLDPLRMAATGDAIADELGDVDPEHAAEYAANAEDLRADLTDLDDDYRSGLATCERDTIVVSHDAFGYLGERYGLDVEAVAGLSPDAEPTPADLARLQQLIAEDGITTVFSERLVSPRLTASLARDAGVSTEVLDPTEGLSPETAQEDYLSLMRSNLEALRTANGCR